MEQCASRLTAAWTSDISFVLDRLRRLNASDSSDELAGRLDMTRIGVFGHSFGGAVAAQFCHDDARCQAGIDIDGALHGSVVQDGLARPFMFLLSDHRRESDPSSVQIKSDIRSIYDRLPPNNRSYLAIRGSFHFMFTDDGVVRKSSIVRGVLRMLGRLGIDARRQVSVTTYCIHTFFDHFLKGSGGTPLSLSSPLYPEIEILE